MIYDCFTFFNELDLLEIRLNVLNGVVDKFVIVEATRTFQNKPKALNFELNRKRFEKFSDKIIYIVVDEYPGFFRKFRKPTAWDFERNQRDFIDRYVKNNCEPTDILVLSDVDEIPEPSKIIENKDKVGIKIFEQRMYYYFLNLFVKDYDEPIPYWQNYKPWRGTIMLQVKDHTNFELLRTKRNVRDLNSTLVREAGWHFSWLGGVEGVIAKLEAYSHAEHNNQNFKNPEAIRTLMLGGRGLFGQKVETILEEDLKNLPYFVQNRIEEYKHLILR